MAYNTPETVADYLARFQMEITHRGKGTFTPDHVKYSLTIASGGKDFFTTFESNPHVHGEPTITQVFGALASDAMVVRDYGMDEFVDEFCDGMKPSAAIRAYNSCKETYDWMRDGLYLSNGDIASLSEVISENEESRRPHPSVPRGTPMTIRSCRRVSLLSRNCKKTSTSGTSVTKSTISTATLPSPSRTVPTQMWTLRTTTSSHGFPTMPSGWKKPSSMGFSKAVRAISTK